jgi:hypothetical protein
MRRKTRCYHGEHWWASQDELLLSITTCSIKSNVKNIVLKLLDTHMIYQPVRWQWLINIYQGKQVGMRGFGAEQLWSCRIIPHSLYIRNCI